MLSSETQIFHTITTNSPHISLKPKKRRKRRKKLKRNPNYGFSSSSAQVINYNVVPRSKQYFQHDNRLGHNNTKIKQTQFTPSCNSPTFNKYNTEGEILYNEVAKKFKPLNQKKKPEYFNKSTKAFLSCNSQRNLKAVQRLKLKRILGLKSTVNNFRVSNRSTQSPTLSQPQYCLCACQTKLKEINNNINLELNSATTSDLFNCTNHMPITQNDFTKIFKHFQNQTPSILLETILNNANLYKMVEKPRRYIIITYNYSFLSRFVYTKRLISINLVSQAIDFLGGNFPDVGPELHA